MLREFSRRTAEDLRGALPLRLALPAFEPFLADNVAKEARKDAMVIHCAGEALAAGAPPAPAAALKLLAAARDVDREFLARLGELARRIEIRYERIEPLRLRRIELGLDTAYRILDAWRGGGRLRGAFPPGEFERRLREVLQSYADETLALSHSVRLPGLLEPLRERVSRRLLEAMTRAAQSLAREAR